MSQLQIPLSISEPRADLLVELEGRDYFLDLAYNPRGEFWAMTIKDSSGVILAAGQKLPGDMPLLRLFDNPDLPPGRFWVVDASGPGRDPDRTLLGVDVLLIYDTSDTAGTNG